MTDTPSSAPLGEIRIAKSRAGQRLQIQAVRRALLNDLGSHCCHPDCPVTDPRFLEVQPINSETHSAGHKGWPQWEAADCLLLCLNHNRELGARAYEHPLRKWRDDQLVRAAAIAQEIVDGGLTKTPHAAKESLDARTQSVDAPTSHLGTASNSPDRSDGLIKHLEMLINHWVSNSSEKKEESWQVFLAEHPVALIKLFPTVDFVLREKCYVGGKTLDNTGGNVLDFVAQNIIDRGLSLLEIKPPTDLLMTDSPYRNGVYSPTSQLVSGVMQVLESRRKLQEHSVSLIYNIALNERPIIADPPCYLLIGNMEEEKLDGDALRSFNLFRNNIKDVTIITYDELFGGLKGMRDFLHTLPL